MAGSLALALGLAGAVYGGKTAIDFGSNVLASNISSHKQFKYAKRLAELQYRLNQKSLLESPGNQRTGLTNAGYNAMLPYMSGTMTNAPSVGLASATGAPVEGVNGSLSDASSVLRLGDEIKNLRANTDATNAGAELSREQAKTEEAKRVNLQFQNAMLDVEKHLKQKDLSTYDRRFYSYIYEQMQRAENYRALTGVTSFNAQTARMDAETNRINATEGNPFRFGVDKLRKFSNWQPESSKNVNKSNLDYWNSMQKYSYKFGR